jgi:hypothetical protein
MEEFLTDGGKTIGIIVGMGRHGITMGYPMHNFERCIKGMFVRKLDIESLKGEGSLSVVKI